MLGHHQLAQALIKVIIKILKGKSKLIQYQLGSHMQMLEMEKIAPKALTLLVLHLMEQVRAAPNLTILTNVCLKTILI